MHVSFSDLHHKVHTFSIMVLDSKRGHEELQESPFLSQIGARRKSQCRRYAATHGEDDGRGGNILVGFSAVIMEVPTVVVASPTEAWSRRKLQKTEAVV